VAAAALASRVRQLAASGKLAALALVARPAAARAQEAWAVPVA
jgi:hypothetical protein